MCEINGIFLLNKPIGVSSNHALQQVKRFFKAKKAGHTGSLDPLATGMLPICLGEATKFSHFLLDADKAYQTTAKLGIATSTGDAEGEVVQQQAIPLLTETLIKSVLQQFHGEIEQVPPMYSALKYAGQSLYKLARQGIAIERKFRRIKISSIGLLGFTADTISIEVHCSKGTYIRTLIEDIGKALATVAHVIALHRLWVAPFQNESMIRLTELADNNLIDKLLLPVDAALQSYPVIQLSILETSAIQQGKSLALKTLPPGNLFRLIDAEGHFFGVGELNTEGCLKAKRLLKL